MRLTNNAGNYVFQYVLNGVLPIHNDYNWSVVQPSWITITNNGAKVPIVAELGSGVPPGNF